MTLDELRKQSYDEGYREGIADGMEAMLYPGTPEEQTEAKARGLELLARAKAEAARVRFDLVRAARLLDKYGHDDLADQIRRHFELDQLEKRLSAP